MKKPKQHDHKPAFDERDGVVHVNGAVMEGGGQILRNTVALAAVLNKKLHVFGIRANRPRGGGLRPQHLNGIDLVAQLYQAKTTGFEVGSCDISFEPRGMRADASNATADTKTAGSICLLCQVALPACVFGTAPQMVLTLRGGTNATQAPPVDYFLHVLLPQLAKMGVNCSAKIKRRGFFPKGGGEVQVMVQRAQGTLAPIRLTEQGAIQRVTIHGFHTANLRGEPNTAQLEERLRKALGADVQIAWEIEDVKGAQDRASGCTVVAESDTGCLFGFSALGEAKTGSALAALLPEAIDGLLRNIGTDKIACCDEFLQDQLLLFVALASGTSVIHCGPLSLHTKTAIFFVGQMSGAKFQVERIDEKPALINVEDGIDYEKDFPKSRFRITCHGIALER